ncbi:MAG: FtsX-like permease family protein [Phycisphaerales bacterium]|nr:MAG: FtsX-like permease family protein [Phycisphaerales bacterium]
MYKIIIPTRYLVKRRITYFAVMAVALCVFIVLVVMTVMTGLVTDFKQKNHRFAGDCVVGTKSLVGFAYYEDFVQWLEGADFVEGVSPVIKSPALIRRRSSERNSRVEIMGVDPVRHSRATGFGDTLYYHKDDVSKAFRPAYDPNLPGCILGIDLELQRGARSTYAYQASPAQVGYSISCLPLTAKGALAQAGTDVIDTKTFHYSDNSHSGLPRVDGSIVYVPFEQAQQLCMAGSEKRASAIHIRFQPDITPEEGCRRVAALWQRFRREKAGAALAYLLENVTVQSWKGYRRESIAPMEQEQTVMGVMFGLVAITTVFIVLVVFYMIISHKSKDIGILKSIGVSDFDVIELFSGFAFLVGILGSSIGLSAGWVFLVKINRIEDWLFERFGFQLWDRTIYAIGDIPNRVEPEVLVAIFLSAVAACLAGALLPSWQAARQRPAETLQVNQL